MLWAHEVEAVANGLWLASEMERLPAEEPGPPCGRCGGMHVTGASECPIKERVVDPKNHTGASIDPCMSACNLDFLLRHESAKPPAAMCRHLRPPCPTLAGRNRLEHTGLRSRGRSKLFETIITTLALTVNALLCSYFDDKRSECMNEQ